MIADNGRIDLDDAHALLGDSREHDFRALLRALRERVVDATGLLEDGSALGVQGEVQGRVLDSAEFRPLPVQAGEATVADSAPRLAQPAARSPPTLRPPAKIIARARSDRRGHAGRQPGAGLDVARGRPREHAGRSAARPRDGPRAKRRRARG